MAAVSGAGYNLQWKASSSSTWTTVPIAITPVNLTGLAASTTYQLQVQTVCSAGTGSYSAPHHLQLLAPVAVVALVVARHRQVWPLQTSQYKCVGQLAGCIRCLSYNLNGRRHPPRHGRRGGITITLQFNRTHGRHSANSGSNCLFSRRNKFIQRSRVIYNYWYQWW